MSDISVELIDHMGSDLSVVNAARVSFSKASDWEYDRDEGSKKLSDRDTKLIRYLAVHNHKSPFNHAFASFRVKAPIFVARQLVKHEYLPWNEVSRRYVDEDVEFYRPDVWRKRASDKKQGSSDEIVPIDKLHSGDLRHVKDTLDRWDVEYHEDIYTEHSVKDQFEDTMRDVMRLYDDLLEAGVAPEQARMVLPQSMMTEWIWSGSLFAFAKMCKLRLSPDTQKECRDVAVLVAQSMERLFPVSWKELMSV